MINKDEQGRSLIEILGVITLVAIITVAGFQVTASVQNRYRAAIIQSDVENIVQGIQNLFSFRRKLPMTSNYEEWEQAATDICESKLIDKTCSSPAQWRNEFEGRISVEITSDQDIVITYTKLPEVICRRLMCLTPWRLVIPEAPDQENGCTCGKECDFCPDGQMIFTSK